jgi:hypothetical protein
MPDVIDKRRRITPYVTFHHFRSMRNAASVTALHWMSNGHRAQFVGHSPYDEYHTAYGRELTPAEPLTVIGPALLVCALWTFRRLRIIEQDQTGQ